MPDPDKLWDQLWKKLWQVKNFDWPNQAPLLREIARLSMSLAEACEEQKNA